MRKARKEGYPLGFEGLFLWKDFIEAADKITAHKKQLDNPSAGDPGLRMGTSLLRRKPRSARRMKPRSASD